MAQLTYMTYLMKKGTGDTYSKLIDIVDFPALRDSAESVDTTTLSNANFTSIPGLSGSNDALQFTANYSATDFSTLIALEGEENGYAVWLGADTTGAPDGSSGKFTFTGRLHVSLNGGGVNEVTRMTISIFPSSDIEFSAQ